MKLETLKLGDINPYENNPRRNDDAVNAVIQSIEQCSYIAPIVIDENHIILAGHTRYKALKALGYEEIPCLICDALDEQQKKKYRFLDNKTGEKATWDLMKLEIELEGVDLEGFDFFGMAEDLTADVDIPLNVSEQSELNMEEFGDEQFRYECPKCGFRFN